MSTLPPRISPSARYPPARKPYPARGHNLSPQFNSIPISQIPSSIPTSRGTAHASIPRLREAINSLDSKMASLMSQRDELESHLERAVRLQSPVLRLPSELLSSIFVMGVLRLGDDDPVMVSTLMLVCRYWAQVAINTPVLWATISVSAHDSLDKARRRLARSKSSPLDITINFEARHEQASNVTEQVIHAMDLLRPALWRTRSFCLNVPNRAQAHAALLRCRDDAPLLEVLSIRIYHHMLDDHYSTPPLPLFNGQTPRLNSCTFSSFNFGWDLRLVSNLRFLDLGGYFNGFSPSMETILGILRQCPALEGLSFRNMTDVDGQDCYPPEEEIRLPRVIQLPHLKSVSFNNSGIMRTRLIMGQIAFPALQTMELYYLQNVTSILQHLHTQSLTRLPLRRLRIESSFFNEITFVNLLRRLPSLVKLEMIDVEDASSSLLKGLSSARPWICPKLDTLVLDGCTTLEWDSLRTFVESRLPPNPHAYSRHSHSSTRSSRPGATSSASSAAAAHMRFKALPAPRTQPSSFFAPERLRTVDVTRCHQISKEMVQWLRMYVADVKCEPTKGT